MDILFFSFGLCLPFYVSGPQIANGLWASPSIFIGIFISAASVLTRGATVRLLLLCSMILVFALTSIARHPPSSYAVSLAMLFSVMAPMCLQRICPAQQYSLQRGFMLGLFATLVIVWAEILTQISGQTMLYRSLGDIFRPVEVRMGAHNFFFLYQRPYAAFLEPAHLAIYLTTSLLVLDFVDTRLSRKLRIATILTILLTGSVVGYVLLLGYLSVKIYGPLRRMSDKISRRKLGATLIATAVIGMGVTVFFVFQPDAAFPMLGRIISRFTRTYAAVQAGTMTGSEGSRANMFRVIFDYWQIEGLSGMLFGTGYGNTSAWLIANYGHFEGSSTVARGQLDSIIVGIFLATGIVGATLYLTFCAVCLKRVGKIFFWPIFLMFLLLNFANGFLIAYPMWHLLAVIILLSTLPAPIPFRLQGKSAMHLRDV